MLSLGLGFLFVLVIDNLEDTVVNLTDIEGRLALKVLAVFPHVRRKRREQVARFLIEDKYSQFSEAVAGLRNLLDSPRYEAFTHCLLVISTQPGEGKTITSTSIAISHAQTGKKVLHVDFDLRRPRLVKVWDLELTQERSFSHVLQAANGGEKPDFAKLVNKSAVPGLDVICSLPPEGVSPATIFGSAAVTDFFEWARANYDRIVVDAPPYGIVGDVVSLAAHVDSVIIMCCPDRTHFRPIQYCSRSLTEAGANILGVVVNDVEVSNVSVFDPSSHRHYGYGGYGYGYGYGFAFFPVRNLSVLEPDEISSLYNVVNELKKHYQLIRISREKPFDASCILVRQLHDICDATMLYIGKKQTPRSVLRRVLKLHDEGHKVYAVLTGITDVNKIISGDYI